MEQSTSLLLHFWPVAQLISDSCNMLSGHVTRQWLGIGTEHYHFTGYTVTVLCVNNNIMLLWHCIESSLTDPYINPALYTLTRQLNERLTLHARIVEVSMSDNGFNNFTIVFPKSMFGERVN